MRACSWKRNCKAETGPIRKFFSIAPSFSIKMVHFESFCGLHLVVLVSELPIIAAWPLPRNPAILTWFFPCQNKMNRRGGGHDGSLNVSKNLIFSFQDTAIATIALILAFYKDSEKDFRDIRWCNFFLYFKKAGLRISILNDWLLYVPWQLTLWRQCRPS